VKNGIIVCAEMMPEQFSSFTVMLYKGMMIFRRPHRCFPTPMISLARQPDMNHGNRLFGDAGRGAGLCEGVHHCRTECLVHAGKILRQDAIILFYDAVRNIARQV